MSKSQTLRDLVMERLVVAADEIFALFERTIAEYEEESLRSKQLLETHNKGFQTLSVNLEVGPSPEQTLCIKQEAEPSLEFPLTSIFVKTEDNVEKSFLLQQEPPKENREEPGCSLYLQSDKDKQTYSCSDTDDSDDWEPSAKRTTTCDRQESKTVQRKDSKRGRAQQIHFQKQMKIHNGPFRCPVCNMTFRNKSHFNSHLNTHKGEKPFSCPVCKRSFGQKYHLKRHMITHTGEKQFSCPECSLKSKHRQSILRHISMVHRREKPHSCPVCKKAFAQKSYLITHMRIHTGEKPFCCTVCKKCFLDKSYFKKHLSTHVFHQKDVHD